MAGPNVFQTPTYAESFAPPEQLWSSWANQVDPYNQRNQADLFSPNYNPAYQPAQQSNASVPVSQWAPQPTYWYGTQTPSANEVYYDPQWGGGGTYSTPAVDMGGTLVNQMLNKYQQDHPSAWMGFGNTQGSAANPGTVTSLGGDWAKVDTWTPQIVKAVEDVYNATGVYVPPNFVKSVMKLESGGDPLPRNDWGAYGLMQVTGNTVGNYDMTKVATDNAYNIFAGVNELAQHYLQGNPSDPSQKSWEWAAKRYLGLGVDPSNGTTDDMYWNQVNNNWAQLQNGFDQAQKTGGNATAGTTNFTMIYGGIDAPITQGFGMTDYAKKILAQGGDNEYQYTADYSPNGQPIGHDGIDVGVSFHSRLYAPEAGQIEIIGSEDGQHYYYTSQDDDKNDIYNPQGGELAVRTANGDVYILGHMSQILKADGSAYKVGDQVTAGQFVGFSGQNNGAHVHIEYRQLTPGKTTSGYTAIDPTKAFGGSYAGSYQGTGDTTSTTAQLANSYQSYLQAMIQGKPVNFNTMPAVGGFHDYLYNAMMGKPQLSEQSGANQWMFGGGPGSAGGTTGGAGIVGKAMSFIGAPYAWDVHPSGSAGSTDNPFKTGWDCSAMMVYLDQKYGNGTLPAGSHYQYQYAVANHKLFTDQSQLQPGDLVFFDTHDTQGGGAELNAAGHVGLYIGNGQMVSAMNESVGTAVTGIDQASVGGPFIGAMHWDWSKSS